MTHKVISLMALATAAMGVGQVAKAQRLLAQASRSPGAPQVVAKMRSIASVAQRRHAVTAARRRVRASEDLLYTQHDDQGVAGAWNESDHHHTRTIQEGSYDDEYDEFASDDDVYDASASFDDLNAGGEFATLEDEFARVHASRTALAKKKAKVKSKDDDEDEDDSEDDEEDDEDEAPAKSKSKKEKAFRDRLSAAFGAR